MERFARFLVVIVMLAVSALPALAQSAACPELTGLQRIAGVMSLTNTLMVFAISLGVISAGYLLFKWCSLLRTIFRLVPVEFYEVLGYLLTVALIVSGHWLATTDEQWTSLCGCLSLAIMLSITGLIHKLKPDYSQFFGTLFVVWGVVAAFYLNEYVGFIAVAAFMGMLGFSAVVIPCGYAFGFHDDDALARATSVGFITLALFVLQRIILGAATLPQVHVFEQGVFWIGSFVGYLGLLIASSRWYGNRASYFSMQLITILFGLAALGVGSIFGISPLLGIGGTFFVLYLIEKLYEIPYRSATAYAAVTLLVSLSLYGGAKWAQDHLTLIQPYLSF